MSGAVAPAWCSRAARKISAGSALLFVIFLVAWQWGPGALGIPEFIIPPVSTVWEQFLRMLAKDHLVFHTAITAMQVGVGFWVLGVLLGILCGFALGMSPTAEFVLSPYILAFQIAPKVAIAPLFIIWFGYTVYPKILVCVLIVFFPVMINVLGAVRALDPDVVRLAKSFTANRLQVFWKIEFPPALPPLFAGLRIAATLAVIGVLVGELVGGNLGLGYALGGRRRRGRHRVGLCHHHHADPDRHRALRHRRRHRESRAALPAGARPARHVSLAGRTIVITGAGVGLGRAFAEACATAGAADIVVADIQKDGARRLSRSSAVAGRRRCSYLSISAIRNPLRPARRR